MALLRTLMLARTSNDTRLVQNDVEIYGLARSTAGLAVRRKVRCVSVSLRYRFIVRKNVPLRIGFRLKLAAMSRQRGTPRHASSG